MNYFKSPADWKPSDPNPFSEDGKYGSGWSCFCIDGEDRRINFCGSGSTGLFTFRLGADAPCFLNKLADFLRYEELNGRKVILSTTNPLLDLDSLVNQALKTTPEADNVRSEDPEWVVHSTTFEAWEAIEQDGCLKSLAALKKEGKEMFGLGQIELREPTDYMDYIVLGRIDEVNAEHVVSSRQKDRIVTDENLAYEPGVRLYFDNHSIIRDGLGVRDGLHTIKIHKRLPLKPYLKHIVSVTDFPEREWTPRAFWEHANNSFEKIFAGDNE